MCSHHPPPSTLVFPFFPPCSEASRFRKAAAGACLFSAFATSEFPRACPCRPFLGEHLFSQYLRIRVAPYLHPTPYRAYLCCIDWIFRFVFHSLVVRKGSFRSIQSRMNFNYRLRTYTTRTELSSSHCCSWATRTTYTFEKISSRKYLLLIECTTISIAQVTSNCRSYDLLSFFARLTQWWLNFSQARFFVRHWIHFSCISCDIM